MTDSAFYHGAIAIAAGLIAQAVAVQIAVPGIVLLLVVGVVLGPDLLGVVQPSVFGAGRADLVNLAVTVILFEGGLGLDLARLRRHQRTLVLLLTVGAAISMVGGALAAHMLLGFSWSTAVLFGALMIVTGPTVVTPLLSRLTIDREVRELLISEGVVIDPIGAVVAIAALDYVVGQHGGGTSVPVLAPLMVGGFAGVVAGFGMVHALRQHWIAEDLVNGCVLASVLLVAALANGIVADAGLMAAVAQGVTMANARLRVLARLREFKETITVILLSFLFVVLAADLRVAKLLALGWGAFGVVAILIWVARPLAVALSTIGSEFSARQRMFVAWICPRGIVAAAVAALFRIKLDDAGLPGGDALEALAFVMIALPIAVQGFTVRPVARGLGLAEPSVRGMLVIGADHFGRFLARLLVALDRQVVLIDRSPMLARRARKEALTVYEGDALSVDALEEAGARYADTIIAVTGNQELNSMVVERARGSFRIERALAVTTDPEAEGVPGDTDVFPGEFPGLDDVNRLLRRRQLRVAEYDVPEGEVVGRETSRAVPGRVGVSPARGAEGQGARGDGRSDTGSR